MYLRSLSESDFQALYNTFKAAFASNFVKFQPTKEEFRRRIQDKIRIQPEISAGSFDGSEMVGFILHTSNIYQGIPTAYNGGTGVLPGFRNQKVAEDLYAHLIPKIQSQFLARVLLEVVEVNEYAIKLYEKIGFSFKRRMFCFKQTEKISNPRENVLIEDGNISQANFTFNDFQPSFIDNESHLKEGNEKVILCKVDEELAGFAVYQPLSGRISQLAVSRKHRGLTIGKSLIYSVQNNCKKHLTIMNIPEDQENFHRFLLRCGFENEVNQFEMELII